MLWRAVDVQLRMCGTLTLHRRVAAHEACRNPLHPGQLTAYRGPQGCSSSALAAGDGPVAARLCMWVAGRAPVAECAVRISDDDKLKEDVFAA